MTIRVRGIRAARLAARLMERLSLTPAEVYRAGNYERQYWVHCPALGASGEQEVLVEEGVASRIVCVEEATYKDCATVKHRLAA